jgi:hypothetical protein
MRKLSNPNLITNYVIESQKAQQINDAQKKQEAVTTAAMTIALDELIASGFDKPSDFVSPEGKAARKDPSLSTITKEEHTYILDLIKSAFPEDIQAILPLDAKALNDKQKSDKRYYISQAGSRFAGFGTTLKRRLKAKAEGRTGNQPRTLDVKCIDHLNAVIKACQKAEDASFDVTKVAKQCETVIKLIGTKSK